MNIAFIGEKGVPAQNGGVERYVESLASGMTVLGHNVLVYNRNDYLPERLSSFKGTTVINKPYIKTKNLASISHTLLSLLDVLWRQVDIIHFQGIGPSLLIWIPKLFRPSIKIVATLHSFDYQNEKWGTFAKKMLYWGEMLMCRYSDEIIVLTKSAQKYVKSTYQRESIVIPNGANLYQDSDENMIIPWGLSKDNYIISVSRLIKLKGLQYLITAFKGIKTDKKLLIVGAGEYENKLKEMSKGDNRIIFTGNQTGPTLDQLYANAYLFVQSSEMEGLSISLLEAMAHRTACLVSNIEANKNVLADTGWTFQSRNSQDLKNKLEDILDRPEEVREKEIMAYERIKQNFTWSKVVQEILDIYRK